MITLNDTVVSFSPDEVANMIRDALKKEGVAREPIAVQISVQEPFGNGMTVHNEVPRLTIVLSGGGM